MGMKPNINSSRAQMKTCSCCGKLLPATSFITSKLPFYKDGLVPVCNECIKNYLIENQFNWESVNKVCQHFDIPFIPKEFEKYHATNGDDVFPIYAKIFESEEFETLGWANYNAEFIKLREEKRIEEELPEINEDKLKKLKEKWGYNYDEETLNYLEDLYTGMQLTQNIVGALQIDQALKLCKISYEINSRIDEGSDFDKLLASYDKLVRIAEFTPKNTKNANDFDSVGELFHWLEKKGWVNKFYDNVKRDVVDETLKNVQSWNQRLYTSEPGIGEEITKRAEILRSTKEIEDNYYLENNSDEDLDEYENQGYEELMNEEFIADTEGE